MSSHPQPTPEEQDRARRLKWFRQARFGMFVHWGVYAQLGRQESVMNRERIPVEEYERLADSWKPKPGAARDWARLAKAAGMRYMVMTTRHHDGYCLFHSELTDYCATKRGPCRDLVAEYVAAARDEGLRVGVYYSMMDWRHPDGARCKLHEDARRRFVDYIHGQVRELCTNYGRLDILWYDVPWPLDLEGWESAAMNAMVRELQPGILINNRSLLPEDFGTPENEMQHATDGRAWEACWTFNDCWGYTPIDTRYKDAWAVHHMLRQVASGGGNLLLNIGPDPCGGVPEPCEKVLLEVGAWMRKYGASIYDATDAFEQEWLITGSFTRKGNTLYFHCDRYPGPELIIGGLRCTIRSVKLMGGWELAFEQVRDRLVVRGLPDTAPDPICTVLEMVFEGEPAMRLGAGHVLLSEVE